MSIVLPYGSFNSALEELNRWSDPGPGGRVSRFRDITVPIIPIFNRNTVAFRPKPRSADADGT